MIWPWRLSVGGLANTVDRRKIIPPNLPWHWCSCHKQGLLESFSRVPSASHGSSLMLSLLEMAFITAIWGSEYKAWCTLAVVGEFPGVKEVDLTVSSIRWAMYQHRWAHGRGQSEGFSLLGPRPEKSGPPGIPRRTPCSLSSWHLRTCWVGVSKAGRAVLSEEACQTEHRRSIQLEFQINSCSFFSGSLPQLLHGPYL